MALEAASMTRRSSSSDSSTFSNILVASAPEHDSASDHVSESTPPTSVNDSGSLGSGLKGSIADMEGVENGTGRRSKRSRSSVSSYNLKKLADAHKGTTTANSSRNVSGLTGRTLVADEVDGDDDPKVFGSKIDKALNMDWELTGNSPAPRRSPRKLNRRPSVKDRVKKAAVKVTSVLGKRGREVMEVGKRKLGLKEVEESPKQSKILKELDMGKRGVLDEIDLDVDFGYLPARPTKRQKTSAKPAPVVAPAVVSTPLQKTSDGRRVKKWQKEGLYVGQAAAPKQSKSGKTLQKPKTELPETATTDEISEVAPSSHREHFMTLPMFNYLDKTRDFVIPYDVYAPTAKRGDEKPKDWHKVNRNRLIGDARDLWEKAEKLPTSACVCDVPPLGEQGCGEDCLNRVMQYECNNDNCSLSRENCGNRAFADLAARTKKAGLYDVGVEVIKTQERGFGVRSCRTFAAGQIIMEYTGEIITEGECQRRMREEYQDKQCYYLMELERGLVIDGTKGSMARFINHSCAPNCEVRMMKVNGTPRMAVFAGDEGIQTGEELTYDYNFDNFGSTQQKCYCGAPTCRGFLSKRLNAVELKKLLKEEAEKQRLVAEQAQKRAEAESKKKQIQAGRGSGWRGWLAVDDPEVKERLRAEKKAKEEAANQSTRAMRLAARGGSLPARRAMEKMAAAKKVESPKRRKTIHVEKKTARRSDGEEISENVNVAITSSSSTIKPAITRNPSHGSKFTEQISRPATTESTSGTLVRETESYVTSTSTTTTSAVHREIIRLLDEDADDPVPEAESIFENIDEGEEEDDDDDEDSDSVTVKHNTYSSHSLGLFHTASKGKEVMRNVGQALKGSLKAAGIAGSLNQPKLKQSTLNFAKLA